MIVRNIVLAAAALGALSPQLSRASTEAQSVKACARAFAESLSDPGTGARGYRLELPRRRGQQHSVRVSPGAIYLRARSACCENRRDHRASRMYRELARRSHGNIGRTLGFEARNACRLDPIAAVHFCIRSWPGEGRRRIKSVSGSRDEFDDARGI